MVSDGDDNLGSYSQQAVLILVVVEDGLWQI